MKGEHWVRANSLRTGLLVGTLKATESQLNSQMTVPKVKWHRSVA